MKEIALTNTDLKSLKVRNKQIHLGYFSLEEEAIYAREQKLKELTGELSCVQ